MHIWDPPRHHLHDGPYSFLAYVQHFNIILAGGASPDLASGMYTLKRATRSDGSRLGDVIPLMHILS